MLISSFLFGNFEVFMYNSIQSVPEFWDGINSGNLNTDYLTLIEISKPLDLQFRYIIVKEINQEKNTICAIIYLQLLKFNKKNISFSNSFFLNLLSSLIFRFDSFHILICGNLFAVNFPTIKYNAAIIKRSDLINIISEICFAETTFGCNFKVLFSNQWF